MNKLQQIDDKIVHLKKLKANIETRLALELYRKIKAVLAEDFTPPLALAIIHDSWKSATFKQKEMWQAQALTFLFSGLSRIPSKDSGTVKPDVEQEKRHAV